MPCEPPVMMATLRLFGPEGSCFFEGHDPSLLNGGKAPDHWGVWWSGVVWVIVQGDKGSEARTAVQHRPNREPATGPGCDRAHSVQSRSQPSPPRRAPAPDPLDAGSWPSTVRGVVSGGTAKVDVARNSPPCRAGPGCPRAVSVGRAGSLGCGESGVTSSVRHTRSGIEARTSSSWAPRRRRTGRACAIRRLQRRAPQAEQVPLRRELTRACGFTGTDVLDLGRPVFRPGRGWSW